MKKVSLILLMFGMFLFSYSFAETVILKSGERVEGRIIERTDKYVKIDLFGIGLTYFLDTIQSINGKDPVAFSLPETPSVAKTKPPFFKRALALIEQNNLGEAEAVFKKVLEKDTANWLARTGLEILDDLAKGKTDKEIAVSVAKGVYHFSEKRFQEAIVEFQKAISGAPGYASGYRGLAKTYLTLKQYREAADIYEKLVKISPDDPLLHFNLGIAYFFLQEQQAAKENLLKAKALMGDGGDVNKLRLIEEYLKQIPQ